MAQHFLSFFRFDTRASRWWAFKQMQLAPPHLAQVTGLAFAKMLGTGGGDGFSLWPDWSTFALLQSWDDAALAQKFWQQDTWAQEIYAQAAGHYHFGLSCFMTKGTWQGRNPFSIESKAEESPLMGVLTRARIRPTRLAEFWREVPKVARAIRDRPGLEYYKGVGEWPLIEQATFSLWREAAVMKEFAYQAEDHRRVVQKTRTRDWYSEELFARFRISTHFGRGFHNSFANLPPMPTPLSF